MDIFLTLDSSGSHQFRMEFLHFHKFVKKKDFFKRKLKKLKEQGIKKLSAPPVRQVQKQMLTFQLPTVCSDLFGSYYLFCNFSHFFKTLASAL